MVAALGGAMAIVTAADGADPSLVQWVNAGGVIGLGAFFLLAFMGGRLVPDKVIATRDADHAAAVAMYLAAIGIRDERIKTLEQQQRDDRAELLALIDKMSGPLNQTAQALKDSSQGYGRIVEEMRPPRNDLDVMLRRLEHITDELGKQQDKEP